MVGRPPRLMRRAPPQSVPPDERERLVNMATKLIVATVRIYSSNLFLLRTKNEVNRSIFVWLTCQ